AAAVVFGARDGVLVLAIAIVLRVVGVILFASTGFRISAGRVVGHNFFVGVAVFINGRGVVLGWGLRRVTLKVVRAGIRVAIGRTGRVRRGRSSSLALGDSSGVGVSAIVGR